MTDLRTWWSGIEFATPWAFALLLLVPLWWLMRRRRRPVALAFPRAGTLAGVVKRHGAISRVLVLLRFVALVGMVVALARPRAGAREDQVLTEGIDIVIALDISSSMLAEDFQPQNRLEVAKARIKEFIAARRGDRIGLIAFAGEALTQVPLAVDHDVLMNATDDIQAGMLEDGTAIGTAIATAANRLRDAPGRSRVLVLLTDGENNRGQVDPRTAAQAAAAVGVRIYAIGVGTEGVAPVPVGRGLFGLRYENRPVRIDEALLEDVARRTGGRYFRARDAVALKRICEQIDQLERVPMRVKSYVRWTDLYRWPLAIALGALVLELLLSAWRGPLP